MFDFTTINKLGMLDQTLTFLTWEYIWRVSDSNVRDTATILRYFVVLLSFSRNTGISTSN
jgi:hypothetical protein